MADQKRIIFLYTELANYFLVCVKQLQIQSNAQIHIFHWPVNPEAPFKFDLNIEGVKFYTKVAFDQNELKKLVHEINPHLIYCSGWIDKDYLSVCKAYRYKIPVVGGLDTPWQGNIKQRLRVFAGKFSVQKSFSHLWIAGEPQLPYAKKLGYDSAHILKGVYAADVNHFGGVYSRIKQEKEKQFPKRFIYVGRYLEFKGIYDLWQAFKVANAQVNDKWELWCLGTGAEWEKRVTDPFIKHLGFVQPNDMEKYLGETSVFVLPSRFEPWAVALHEFCAAGFPVICSDKVGAATQFVQEGKNGFIFKAGDTRALTNCFLKFMRMDPEKILTLGENSAELAKKVTPTNWASTLISIL